MTRCLKFLLNHQSSNRSVLFQKNREMLFGMRRWKRVSFPLSLSLSCDNHFPYTCIEFNYKNISGKKGGGEQIVFEIKIALNYNDDAMWYTFFLLKSLGKGLSEVYTTMHIFQPGYARAVCILQGG